MSKNRKAKGRGVQVPLFITKLMEMMENEELTDIVAWTQAGDSFIIKSITRFTEEVLPLYFKHRNFSSFIRQLNMYGFHKIRHSEGQNVYGNDNFKRNQRNLLKNISRKVKQEREERLAIYQGGGNRNHHTNIRELQDLRVKQKDLESMCRHFIVQNQKLMEENNALIQRMEEESREKQKRLQQFLIMLLSQKRGLGPSEGPLSLTNQAYLNGATQTPLEVLSHRLQENDQYHHVRRLIDSIYGKGSKKIKDRNFTIMDPQPELNLNNLQDPPVSMPDPPQPSAQMLDKDGDSFISINDFLNAEDYDNINLEESR